MATLVLVGEVDIDIDVDVDVEDYGSTHDEELVVPLTLMEHNRNHPNTKHLSSNPSWKMKKLMCVGIIGMTVAVASSALVFLSIMDFSKQESIEPSFLLHASVGTKNDNTCVAASGPWPTNSVSGFNTDIDDSFSVGQDGAKKAFVSCFTFHQTVAERARGDQPFLCCSHSYYDPGGPGWKECTPYGMGAQGWSIDSPGDDKTDDSGPNAYVTYIESDVATCGTPCTTFSSDVPH